MTRAEILAARRAIEATNEQQRRERDAANTQIKLLTAQFNLDCAKHLTTVRGCDIAIINNQEEFERLGRLLRELDKKTEKPDNQ